jgi:hypothetical protein
VSYRTLVFFSYICNNKIYLVEPFSQIICQLLECHSILVFKYMLQTLEDDTFVIITRSGKIIFLLSQLSKSLYRKVFLCPHPRRAFCFGLVCPSMRSRGVSRVPLRMLELVNKIYRNVHQHVKLCTWGFSCELIPYCQNNCMCRNIRGLQIFAIFAVTFDPRIHVQREYFYTNNLLIVIFSRFYRTMYVRV